MSVLRRILFLTVLLELAAGVVQYLKHEPLAGFIYFAMALITWLFIYKSASEHEKHN